MIERDAKRLVAHTLAPLMLRGIIAERVNVTKFGAGGGYYAFELFELPPVKEPWQK